VSETFILASVKYVKYTLINRFFNDGRAIFSQMAKIRAEFRIYHKISSDKVSGK
jgi:hypothetical protein